MKKNLTQLLSAAALTAVLLTACGKKEKAKEEAASEEKTEQAAPEEEKKEEKATEPSLLAENVQAPAGAEWEDYSAQNAFTVKIPKGADWEKTEAGYLTLHHKKDDITVLVQVQSGADASMRDATTEALISLNKRDAPKYEVTEQPKGSVQSFSASRIDGKFDNGTKYVTRDYVVFIKDNAVALMARAPEGKKEQLYALVDYLASTIK